MKGYRFYEEFDSSYKKRKHQGSGNVLALDLEKGRPVGWLDGQGRWVMSCTAAVLSEPQSPVCGTAVSREVLAKNYRRIPETKAREIHPNLFAWLDSFEGEVDA